MASLIYLTWKCAKKSWRGQIQPREKLSSWASFLFLSIDSSFWLYCSHASLKEWFTHPQSISRVTYSTWKQNPQDPQTKTTSLVCQRQMIHLGMGNLAETGCNILRVVTNLVKTTVLLKKGSLIASHFFFFSYWYLVLRDYQDTDFIISISNLGHISM